MSRDQDRTTIGAHINSLGLVITAGASCLIELREQAGPNATVSFDSWVVEVRKRLMPRSSLPAESFQWAWNALREEPTLILHLGKLPAAGVRWTNSKEQFDVLPGGSQLVVALTASQVVQLQQAPLPQVADERIVVTLKGLLRMKPGKAERLECCDVAASVAIAVSQVFSREREADVMRVDRDRVSVAAGRVIIEVDSLNQAYTVASRRLEPDRRSHGGRIYDRFLYVDSRSRVLLETIRRKVEDSTWSPPFIKDAVKDSRVSTTDSDHVGPPPQSEALTHHI